MPRIVFTENLQRHLACQPATVDGTTVRQVLDAVFSANERARGYVLDEHGEVRKHMIVFVNGTMVRDRRLLTDSVDADATVYVMQALSGG